jgi:hypothetical protein
MKAIVKSMWVDSATINLDSYLPDDTECFGLWIEFRVGIKDEDGADDFRLLVCTPEWLKNEYGWKKAVWGRHMLIVSGYDLNVIAAEINSCVENCAGEDWPTIAQKLARFAAWEYEDVQL